MSSTHSKNRSQTLNQSKQRVDLRKSSSTYESKSENDLDKFLHKGTRGVLTEVYNFPTFATLAERLRWARTILNDYTQKEVANISGTSRDVITKLESGQIKQTRHIVEIADALHIPPAWLQFGEENFDHLSKDAIQWASQYDRLTPRQRAIIRELVNQYYEINQEV